MTRNSKASKSQRNRWRKWHNFYNGIEEALLTGRITQALVAGHEGAHSIIIIKNRDIPEQFLWTTIIGRDGRDGETFSTRKRNADCSIRELKAVLMATMAGRALEEKLVGVSTGHEDDMEDARQTAKELVRRRGGTGQRRAVERAIEDATKAAGEFLEEHWNAFEKV
ncbi:hypothetical protein niasHT_000975 [Heterodera trifolii]|uniref:Peptidase M41 domain-containing protein n=1 Tax=Heterodera trifolii TaxID=157864 RepID=A0ABD2M4J1_9BILA